MAGYRETANAWEVRKYRLKSVLRRFYFCVFPAIEFFNSHSPYHQPNARWGKYAAISPNVVIRQLTPYQPTGICV
jgi:hypothetical protein